MQYYGDWAPYVSVGQRAAQAAREIKALRKEGVKIQPVEIQGLKIAKEFWGKAWCDHIESFNDFENRLPRGRTYVRNGSVCHLAISKGTIKAKVMGSDLYDIEIKIKTLSAKKWKALKQRCSGQIGSLLELLQGRLSDSVMQEVTNSEQGLFPQSDEISLDCDCPDWADLCKHLAAVLYGVGARLDQDPALLFLLRGVNHEELIDVNAQLALQTNRQSGKSKQIASDDLSDVFGIDIAADEPKPKSKAKVKRKKKKSTPTKKTSSKKPPTKKIASKKKPTAAKKKKVVSKKATKKAGSKAKKSSVTKKAVTKKPATKKTTTKKRAAVKKKMVKQTKKQTAPKKKMAKKTLKKVIKKPAIKMKKKVARKSKTTNQTVAKKSTPKKNIKKTVLIKKKAAAKRIGKKVVKRAAVRQITRKRS